MTQRDRVLAALRRAGPQGVGQVDIVTGRIDGRAAILRGPSRINELRAAGFAIETKRESDGTARYVLRGEPDSEAPGTPPPAPAPVSPPAGEPLVLLDLPAERRPASHYDERAWS
jgi:hypothetical protein